MRKDGRQRDRSFSLLPMLFPSLRLSVFVYLFFARCRRSSLLVFFVPSVVSSFLVAVTVKVVVLLTKCPRLGFEILGKTFHEALGSAKILKPKFWLNENFQTKKQFSNQKKTPEKFWKRRKHP